MSTIPTTSVALGRSRRLSSRPVANISVPPSTDTTSVSSVSNATGSSTITSLLLLYQNSSSTETPFVNHREHTATVQKEIEADTNGGDGSDSDEEGEESLAHAEGMIDSDVKRDRIEYADEDKRGETKGFVELTGRGSTKVIGNMIIEEDGSFLSSGTVIGNRKNDIKIMRPPESWSPPEHNKSRDEPDLANVDNLSGWSRYCFRHQFLGRSKTAKYKHYCLPTGTIPVSNDTERKRKLSN